MHNRKFFDIVMSIVIGIAIWLYVISELDPVVSTTIKAVPVQLLNMDSMVSSGLAIAGSGEYTVDVDVSGTKSTISDAKALDFSATADVSGLRLGQNYITVNVTAPNTLTINEIRTQNIQVYVDYATSVEKEITVVTANAADGLELGSLNLSDSVVTVSGAQSLVDSVKAVNAVIDVKGRSVDAPTTEDISLVAVDADGKKIVGISLSLSQISCTSTLYNVKQVALNVPITGEVNEHVSILSEIIPTSVNIKGSTDVLANVWQIESSAIDKSKVTETCSIPLNLVLPNGIELANASKNIAVSYELKGRVEKTLTFDKDQVQFVNVQTGYLAELKEPVEITFSVYEDEVEDLNFDNVAFVIDMKNSVPGESEPVYELGYAEMLDDVMVINGPGKAKVSLTKL